MSTTQPTGDSSGGNACCLDTFGMIALPAHDTGYRNLSARSTSVCPSGTRRCPRVRAVAVRVLGNARGPAGSLHCASPDNVAEGEDALDVFAASRVSGDEDLPRPVALGRPPASQICDNAKSSEPCAGGGHGIREESELLKTHGAH